jgi:hypothetical protein
MIRDTVVGQMKWASDPELLEWLAEARLDGFTTPEVARQLASAGRSSSAAAFETMQKALAKIGEYLRDEQNAGA